MKKTLTGSILASTVCLLMITGCGKESTDKSTTEDLGGGQVPDAAAVPAFDANSINQPQTDPNKVIVTVGDRKLTSREMDFGLRQYCAANRIPPQYMEQIRPQAQAQVIDGFVMQTLLHNEAKKRGISIPKEKFDETLAGIQSQLPPGASIEEELKKNGLSYKEWVEGIEGELRVRAFIEQLTEKTPEVSEQEIKDFYEDNKDRMTLPETVNARHILIRVPEDATEEVKKEKLASIENIRTQLLAGSNFMEMAQAYSDCPSKSKGGDLGKFPRNQMVPEFDAAAFSQKVDEIGPVVTTQYGYHVIQVQEHDKGGTKTLEEVRDDLMIHLQERKKADSVMKLVEELRPNADIKYAPGYEPQPKPVAMPAAPTAKVGTPITAEEAAAPEQK